MVVAAHPGRSSSALGEAVVEPRADDSWNSARCEVAPNQRFTDERPGWSRDVALEVCREVSTVWILGNTSSGWIIGNGATPVERLNEDLIAVRPDECGWQSAEEWSGESPQ